MSCLPRSLNGMVCVRVCVCLSEGAVVVRFGHATRELGLFA